MFRLNSNFSKNGFFATKHPLYTRTFLAFLVASLTSIYVLPNGYQAHADDIRDLDSIEALKSKWDELKKEGLSAGDVKKLTDKLKELGGDDIDGTGVGQLLDGMNANAERLANLKDAAGKLEKTIALVEKFKNLETGDKFDGKATMEALADTIEFTSDLMEEVPPPFGTIAGPMLKAYAGAVKNGAAHVGAIQAATKAKNEAIAIAGGEVPATEEPEDVDDSFEWNVYPYKLSCPDCETDWWIAGNSASRASALEGAYQTAKKETDALSEQAKETRDKLVKEGYRERTAERMANEQEVLFEGRKTALIEAYNRLLPEVHRLEDAFEKADEHAKKIRQMFIDCLEKCNEEAGGAASMEPSASGASQLSLKVFDPLGNLRDTHINIYDSDGNKIKGAWTNRSPFDLPPGSYKVQFGYALGIMRNAEVAAGKITNMELRNAAGRLTLKVFDAVGNPRDTHVNIYGSDGKQVVGAWTNHSPFDLPPGSYKVQFGYALGITRDVEVAAGKVANVELRNVAGRLTLKVLDVQGNLRDTHINIYGSDGNHLIGAWTSHSPFELPPGSYKVQFDFDEENMKSVTVRAGQTEEIQVKVGTQ